jgi:hypothetical protein
MTKLIAVIVVFTCLKKMATIRGKLLTHHAPTHSRDKTAHQVLHCIRTISTCFCRNSDLAPCWLTVSWINIKKKKKMKDKKLTVSLVGLRAYNNTPNASISKDWSISTSHFQCFWIGRCHQWLFQVIKSK